MSEDDLVFVWNCCDELEKARERETVLRIVESLRDRFSPVDGPTLTAELTGIAPMHQAGVIERERPAHAPWTGYQGEPEERTDLNTPDGSGDFIVE